MAVDDQSVLCCMVLVHLAVFDFLPVNCGSHGTYSACDSCEGV